MKTSHEMTVSVLRKRDRILRRRRMITVSIGALAGTAAVAAALVVTFNSTRPRGVDLIAQGNVSDALSNEILAATEEGTGDSNSNGSEEAELTFVPVLTEDDIEYMGVPYKDLTADQFIQLWAQCTRECNVQRLYVMTYNNSSYTDELTGETIEPTELQSEQLLKETAQLELRLQLMGRMLSMYSNVELFKIDDAPEGYYGSDAADEHHYYITYTKKWIYFGEQGEQEGISWITLKKINGYWKIGVMMSSSPYFFETQMDE